MELENIPIEEEIDIEFNKKIIKPLGNSTKILEDSQKQQFKQINENNSAIKTKIELTQKVLANNIQNTKGKFSSITISGNKHLKKYSNSVLKILNCLVQLEFVLLFLLIPSIWEWFVSVFPQYASIIPIPPDLAKLIFVAQISVFMLAIYFFYTTFTKEDKNLDTKNFDNLDDELKKIEELQNIPYDVDSEITYQTNIVTNLKNSVVGAASQIKETIPVYKQIHEEDKFRKKWDVICDSKKNVLIFFGISNINLYVEEIKNEPDYDVRGFDDITVENSVIQKFSAKLNIDSSILTFLSDFYNGKTLDNNWLIFKKDDRLKILTKILFNSKRLDILNRKIPEIELFEILIRTEKFDIGIISKNCVLYQRVGDYLQNYRTRLGEEKIFFHTHFSNIEIIKNLDFSQEFRDNFLTLFSREIDNNLEFNEKKIMRDAILAILLNNDLDFRTKVCQKASESAVVIILLAYHEISRKKQEQNLDFKLSDLLTNQEIFSDINERLDFKSTEYDPELFDRFNYFKTSLSQGKWFNNEIFLMRAMLLEKFDQVNRSLQDAKKYQIIQKIIDENFKNISINIVEKAIDANLISTYVILTAADEGKFRDIINLLSGRDTVTKELKENPEIKATEEKYGISLWKGKHPKYDFVNYSKGTKVGVLEQNTHFIDFKEDLMSDIAKVLKYEVLNQEETKQWIIGLSVVRITPSKYSFGIPDKQFEGIKNVEIKNLEIVKIISKLAQDYLNDSQKAVITHFDKNIDMLEIINQQNIYNLISQKGIPISEDYRRFLEKPQVKNTIFAKLKEREYEIQNFKHLAIAINNKTITKKQTIEIFDDAISSEYFIQNRRTMNPNTLKEFTHDLYNSLNSVALLWKK
jgi:hypothetical protein